MLIRRICVWLAVVLLVFLISACGTDSNVADSSTETEPEEREVSNDPPTVPEKEEEPEENLTPEEPVELIFYSQVADYDETFTETFGNKIHEEFPHIKVTHLPAGANKFADLVTTGQTIDVLFMSIGQADSLILHDYQYDITELVEKYDYDLSRLEPSTIDLQRALAGGGIYGLPVFTNTVGLFYNRDIFDTFGVEYPPDGMTWPELYDLAEVMARSDGETQYYGLAMSSSANFIGSQYSPSYVDPETRKSAFTSEPFLKTMQLFTGVSNIRGNGLTAENWSLANQQKLFPEGRSAMFLHLVVYGLSYYKDLFNWDVATYPEVPEMPGVGPQSYPSFFYVTQTSEHKDEAFQVIAYLTSDEFQNHLARRGMLPILKDSVASMAEFGAEVPYLQDKNVQALLPKQFAPSQYTSVDIIRGQSLGHSHFFAAYQKVVLGLADINTALREEGEKLDQKLAELFNE